MLAWRIDAFAGLLLRVRTGLLTDASLPRLEVFFDGLLDLEAARLAGLVARPVTILSSEGSRNALTGDAFIVGVLTLSLDGGTVLDLVALVGVTSFVGVLALALEGVVFLVAALDLVALAGVASLVGVLALDLDGVVFFLAALIFVVLAGVASFANAANFAGVSLAGEAFFATLPACTRSAVAAASRALTEGVVRRGEDLVARSGVAALDLAPFAGDDFLLALAGVPFARAFAMTAI